MVHFIFLVYRTGWPLVKRAYFRGVVVYTVIMDQQLLSGIALLLCSRCPRLRWWLG